MKSVFLTSCVGAIFFAACLTTHTAYAGKSSQLELIKKELRAVTVAEMPAMAGQLVSQAKPDARETTAEAVVTAANALRPVAILAVVSAIARDNPDVAPAAAAKAASLRPKEAAAIARAAAGAAPGQASKIVYAVCKAVPKEYSAVATGVSQVVPGASKEQIWGAVTEAVPAVKRTTLASAAPATVGALPPPTVGPPFTPVPPSPTEINRGNTAEVPPGGGRNYSGP